MELQVDQQKIWIRELSSMLVDNILAESGKGYIDNKTEEIVNGLILNFLESKKLVLTTAENIRSNFLPQPKAELVTPKFVEANNMNFLGTWKLRDGRFAIVLSKSKYIVSATRGEEIIWIGMIITHSVGINGSIPMIWMENGHSFYGIREEDLVEAVRVKV